MRGMSRCIPLLGVGAAAVLAVACSGSSNNNSPAPAPVTTTQVFTGTTTQAATGGCTGDSHNFEAKEGAISVRLVETSDPAGALSVQVCAGGIDNGNCSIRQQKILVNQTLTGSRIGISTQNLKMLGHSCVFGGPPATSPISYRVELTYQR